MMSCSSKTINTDAVLVLLFETIFITLVHLLFTLAYDSGLEPNIEMRTGYNVVTYDVPPPYEEVEAYGLGVEVCRP